MWILQLIGGVACLLVGIHNIVRREAIVARHRRLHPDTFSLLPPMAYIVMGGMLAMLGVVTIALASISL